MNAYLHVPESAARSMHLIGGRRRRSAAAFRACVRKIPPAPWPTVLIRALADDVELAAWAATGARIVGGPADLRADASDPGWGGLVVHADHAGALDLLRAVRARGDDRPAIVVGPEALAETAFVLDARYLSHPRDATRTHFVSHCVACELVRPAARVAWALGPVASWVSCALAPCALRRRHAEIITLRALGCDRRVMSSVLGIGPKMLGIHITNLLHCTGQLRLDDVAAPFATRLEGEVLPRRMGIGMPIPPDRAP